MPKAKSEIKCEELAEIKSYEDGKPSFKVIRVVAWNDGDPQVECRWMMRTRDGLRTGRATGFSIQDLALLVEKFPKIKALIERGEGIGKKTT